MEISVVGRSKVLVNRHVFSFLMMLIGLGVLFGRLGIFGEVIQKRLIDSSVENWIGALVFAFFSTVFLLQLRLFAQYWRRYITDDVGLAEVRCIRRTRISWSDVTEVNRLIEPTRSIYMAFVNRRALWIGSPYSWIIVYEELDGYDEFRALVGRECKARGVPMFERNSGWEVVDDKQRWRAAKRVTSRTELRGRLNGYEEHLIDEL
jgi:hypothetical protein